MSDPTIIKSIKITAQITVTTFLTIAKTKTNFVNTIKLTHIRTKMVSYFITKTAGSFLRPKLK